MTPFSEEERALLANPELLVMINRVAAAARRKGIVVSDDSISDAIWQAGLAAKRYVPGDTPFLVFAVPWVRGAIGRSARKSMRYQSTEIEQIAPTDEDDDPVKSNELRLLRLAIERLESPCREVAELRAKGLGVRKIAKRLKLSFHETRSIYNAVSEKLAQSFGYRFRDGKMVTVDRPLFEGF
jgi:RNA polymerase sigma factor (sigma-70 family)